ncbi:hypothetical protein EYF80_030904 [Liparis tanakae]|uniref:Uncharacterized protein n=1 Tax=Liparis tanakae TaxID=230148 RepID=A0A4Z2H247_9TELE|nr:hypothetical protein EYF80_030904 [Liparis tanakae]
MAPRPEESLRRKQTGGIPTETESRNSPASAYSLGVPTEKERRRRPGGHLLAGGLRIIGRSRERTSADAVRVNTAPSHVSDGTSAARKERRPHDEESSLHRARVFFIVRNGNAYITDPSEAADVRKPDSACSSLYQPHHLPRSSPLGDEKQKQGFNNLGYSRSNDSTLKLEVDNNHVNHRLHAAPPPAKEPSRQGGAAPQHAADGALYIIQPDAAGPRWDTMRDKGPSQVPVYPQMDYENQRSYGERGPGATRDEWGRGDDDERAAGSERLSADEIDEGVGGTPEYPCDTGDEASVLSVEIHTSTTSLSSADTRDELRPPKTPGAAKTVTKGEEEEEEEEEAAHSITDSMVAEALAAMEAATAGEDSE